MTAVETSGAEDRFVAAVRGMLARPDYLIPLAAAERQYRDHYYGLNSAALLEDLFFDALGNYVRQTRPTSTLSRPPTGQKGWDYAFDGLQISHKVSQELGEVAALWDATKVGITHWSFDDPIVYVLGKNAPSTGVQVHLDASTVLACRSVADLGAPYLLDGRALLVVRWPVEGSQPQLLELVESGPGQRAEDILPFKQLWRHVARNLQAGRPANEIDVLVTSRAVPPLLSEQVVADGFPQDISISVGLRGGVYLLRRELLQELEVKTNNRGILIPRETIRGLLHEAADRLLFAPVPIWYWIYAQRRPPDMYSAQRLEYDARFSARGELDEP